MYLYKVIQVVSSTAKTKQNEKKYMEQKIISKSWFVQQIMTFPSVCFK